MKKIKDFLKFIREKNTDENTIVKNENIQQVHIQIDGNTNLFKNEKEKILQGARQLLEIGKADDIEDAIISCAVVFRGLKYKETKKTEDGKTVIVLQDLEEEIIKEDDEIRL